MNKLAFIVGLVAVTLYLLSYQQKKRIRQVSFLGSPFWLVYNFVSGAYGSCIGDLLSMVSIGIAMFRYDIKAKQ